MTYLRKSVSHIVLIVLIGCAAFATLAARKEDEKLPEIRLQPMSVKTMRVKRTDYGVRVPAWGLVEPRETIDIRAEVSGKVAHVPSGVFAGAAVRQGELLFAVDDRDYRNALAETAAANEQALQALEIEKGKQAIARAEWRMLAQTGGHGGHSKALALREPHFRDRQAAVHSASARQAQALIDLERTRTTSPCDGVILTENLAEGRVLDSGDVALRIACINCYHVTALFSPDYSLDPGVRAAVDVDGKRYEGTVKAVLPQISAETRRKQALVEFRGEQVTLGAYASLTLSGPLLKNVAVLPEEALRPENTVWVLSDRDTLEIRNVTVLARDMRFACVGNGLKEGDRVILSHIASPLRGMQLSTAATMPEAPDRCAAGRKLDG